MISSLQKLAERLIWVSFISLAVVTPLLFSTRNTELFEVPKMHFVYFFATLLFFLTLIKSVLQGKITFPKNWSLIILVVFVATQILSAFSSIDKFTSVFGYPSRLNGGLLSQFAYLIIFAMALVNLSQDQAKKLLMTIILGALAVALWGIPGHFGRDPSCLVLTGKLTSNCWQKEFDPQTRIFSTLGQPNWLASYLVIVLPFSVYFLLTYIRVGLKIFSLAVSLILYTALIMSTSRAGLLGLLVGLVILVLLLLFRSVKIFRQNFLWLGLLIAGTFIVTAFFGQFLFERLGEAINKFKPQAIDRQIPETNKPTNLSTQSPASGGTESGTIRLIVWKGALEAFKHRPILGFGPETFAYSYYLFRPLGHNQTTEWNFFYNKAHNEFLNYLAGVGFIGASLYVAFLVTTLAVFYKLIRVAKEEAAVLLSAGMSATVGYQTSIFFGFSTVTSQVIFYLVIALILIYANNQKLKTFELKLANIWTKYITSLLLVIAGAVILTIPIRFYLADLLINRAKQVVSSDMGQALKDYDNAIRLFLAKNPFYLADNAYAQAIYATSFEDKNIKEKLAKVSGDLASQALNLSPNNLIVERKAANAFFVLAEDDNEYAQKALEAGSKLTKLAPTDPQSYYTLAQIQAGVGKENEARKSLEKALELKPDYPETRQLLEQLQ